MVDNTAATTANRGDIAMANVVSTQSASSPELSELRAALLTQRAELIGELAAVMANQFNNTMMAISSYAELELKKAPAKEQRSLEKVLSNAASATLLIQKLIAYSRKRTPSPAAVELNTTITEVSELLKRILGDSIEVVLNLDPQVHRIKVDRTDFEQLVLSLALGARSEMKRGGKLTLSTELVKLNKDFIGGNEEMIPGKYAMFAIQDVGAAQQLHAGEDESLRVNLALVSTRDIVEQAHGLMRIASDPAKGTSIKLYFPALGKEAPDASEPVQQKKSPIARTILVVEDDEAVRVPAAEFLMMEGFKVLQARTGVEAIRVAEQNRSPLDLLITDIVMPGMGGREVAEQLTETHPDLKVLYMSGDAQAVSRGSSQDLQGSILQKPFRLNRLKEKINEVLER